MQTSVGREAWGSEAQSIFRAMKLNGVILQRHTYVLIYLSKPTACTSPREKHNGNFGLWGLMRCPCRFISHTKCTILVADAHNGGGWAWGGEGNTWDTSVCCSQFYCGTKTASKVKSTEKEMIFNLWEHVNTIVVMFSRSHYILETHSQIFISKMFNTWHLLLNNERKRGVSEVLEKKKLTRWNDTEAMTGTGKIITLSSTFVTKWK